MSEQDQSPIVPKISLDSASAPPYFPVSTLKLVIMSFCTLGVYEIYWFWMNWCSIKRHGERNIMPIWRSLFAPLSAMHSSGKSS